jgi:hypothetical protein
MHLTHRARRLAGVPVALIALSLAIAVPAASPSPSDASAYAVVLADGSIVPASTRPLIAMGKVSFLDGNNRSRTLPVQRVDVEATRARSGSSAPRGRTWDERAISAVRGRIQVVGESEGVDDALPGEDQAPSGVELADMTQAERIRSEIDRLGAQILPLAPKDRQRTVLMLRQLELQQELSRILHSPSVES